MTGVYIIAPLLSHTARWKRERECGSHRQQPTTLRCSLATHHLSYQHVCERTVGSSYLTAGYVHVRHFSFIPYQLCVMNFYVSYTPFIR